MRYKIKDGWNKGRIVTIHYRPKLMGGKVLIIPDDNKGFLKNVEGVAITGYADILFDNLEPIEDGPSATIIHISGDEWKDKSLYKVSRKNKYIDTNPVNLSDYDFSEAIKKNKEKETKKRTALKKQDVKRIIDQGIRG
jgi:hypothetical protein